MPTRDEITEQILQLSDIVDIVGEYVNLKKSGKNFLGLCPFHNEKTPSFTVSPELGIYKCFGCGKSGNVFSFLMEHNGMTFPEAKESLAKRLGISIHKGYQKRTERVELTKKDLILKALSSASQFYSYILHSTIAKPALSYLIKRNYSDITIKQYNLGFAPDSWDAALKELQKQGFEEKILLDAGLILERNEGGYYDRFRNRIIFPIKDYFGRIVAFGARILTDDKNHPKYINSPQTLVYDKSKTLYGLFEAKNFIRNQKFAILVEGYADVLTLHQSGIMNAVASSGTSLTTEMLQQMKRLCDKIYFVYDADSAGIKATERGLELALEMGFDINISVLPSGDDPDSLVNSHGKEVFMSYIRDAKSFLEFKTWMYKNSGRLATPSDKAHAAREMMQLISRIPDRLQHDYYISQLASYLDLNEAQLNLLYKEKSSFEVKNKQAKTVTNQYLSDKSSRGSILDVDKEARSNLAEQTSMVADYKARLQKILPEEVLILHFAITENTQSKVVFDKFKMTEKSFLTKDARNLFRIVNSFESSGRNLLHDLIASHEIDEADRELLTSIAFREEPSTHWIEFGSLIPEMDIEKNIYNAVIKLEIRFIDMKLSELQSRLREVAGTAEETNCLIELKNLNLRKEGLIKKLNTV